MAVRSPHAIARTKKQREEAEKVRKTLDMGSDLDYVQVCNSFEQVMREKHIPALERDIVAFAATYKEKAPLNEKSKCVQSALLPLKYDMRFLQAELVMPRMMLPLIEDNEKRETMRKIHETVFVFHALLYEQTPEMCPLYVSNEDFNSALETRAKIMTREEYEALIPKVPGFTAMTNLAQTAQTLVGEALARANKTLLTPKICTHCQKVGARRCTGCKERLFCSQACQRQGEHDASCPVTVKRNAAAPAAVTD